MQELVTKTNKGHNYKPKTSGGSYFFITSYLAFSSLKIIGLYNLFYFGDCIPSICLLPSTALEDHCKLQSNPEINFLSSSSFNII